MLLGIARSSNLHFGIGLQKRDHIAGMGKITVSKLLVRHILRTVTTQRQDSRHIRLFQLTAYIYQHLFPAAHTGHMCESGDLQRILNIRCNVHRLFGAAATGTICHAHKAGMKLLQTHYCIQQRGSPLRSFRGEELE